MIVGVGRLGRIPQNNRLWCFAHSDNRQGLGDGNLLRRFIDALAQIERIAVVGRADGRRETGIARPGRVVGERGAGIARLHVNRR